MELTVAKKDLLRLLSRVQGVAEKKSTMAALTSVLLAVDGPNALRIAATDLYLSLQGRVPADIKKGGSVAVPAKDLLERVKMMPDGPIHITTGDGAQTTLKAQGSARRYTLRGLAGEDFPALPAPEAGAASLSLPVDVLKELIDKTRFSISSDETRAHLNSALFEWDGDVVRMVTTDGHRLSKMQLKVPGSRATAAMLVPQKAIGELRGLCDDVASSFDGKGEKPALQITQSGASAFFQGEGLTFSVKLVDAQFPPYQQVIPQNADKIVKVPRAAFADALRAVSIAASERNGGVKLHVAQNQLRITSESPDSGDGFDEVPAEYEGPALTIGFNAKYFLDVLSALGGEDEVALSLFGELDPAVVRPTSNTQDRDFLAVVMPMMI